MKTKMTYLAGLALAATLCLPAAIAQSPPSQPLFKPGPPAREKQTEVFFEDEGAPLAAALGEAERTVRKIFTGPGDALDRPLIISTSAIDANTIANLDEDLNIMSRVLDKSINGGGDDGDRKAMGIHLWALGAGNRGARNIYLDGHGAIFILNVNMQLQAPAEKSRVEEKKEPANSTWEDARAELYGRNDRRDPKGDKRPAHPFDGERVEELKKDLSEALKHATHIRGLKDNEYVTLVVQGAGSDRPMRTVQANSGKGERSRGGYAYAAAGSVSGPRSVMTLRAKKSDIDAFAKSKTELDDFRKRVSVSVYQTPGAPAGSGELRVW